MQSTDTSKPAPKPRAKSGSKKVNSVKGLVIACTALLLAIILMLIFIYFRYFKISERPEITDPVSTGAPVTNPPKQTLLPPDSTAEEDLSCTELKLSETTIPLNNVGDGWLLNAIPVPANTTDEITFTSSNPAVATVSPKGNVIAVSAGEAVITVKCGDITAECKVVCNIAPPPTETEPPATETTAPPVTVDFVFNTPFKDPITLLEEVTLTKSGEKWCAYKGEISLTDINWSVGNTSVAVVNNGWVTAVGEGKTMLYAEVNGVTYSCLIRCDFD